MSDLPGHDEAPRPPPASVAELLSACLETASEDRRAALERLCEQHPDRATSLRGLFGALDELGLIDDPDGDPPAPRRLGPYRVLRLLGSGGMGTVYLAEHETLGRRAAVKVIHTAFARAPRARERFRREGLAASKLEHPSICTVYEVGEEGDTPYLAMRHAPGATLAAWIERAAAAGHRMVSLPPAGPGAGEASGGEASEPEGAVGGGPDERGGTARDGASAGDDHDRSAILRLIETLARALHVAHEAGLVHRDVKPGNVIVTPQGEPVLLDFGLARLAEGSGSGTPTAAAIGTPAYMAPEQINGIHTPDRRADVYALGVVLYECLTLRTPFAGEDRQRLFEATVRHESPDPLRHDPRIGRDLRAVLRTALAKDPAHRYHSAHALAEDLRGVRLGLPIAVRRPSFAARTWRWSRRHPAAAVLLLALSLTQAGAGLQAWRAQDDQRLARRQASLAATHVAWTRLLSSTAALDAAQRLADELVPPWPEMAPRLTAWLREHGEPLAALLAEVRQAQQDLQSGAETPRTRLLAEELATLSAALGSFAEAPEGALAQARARLAWARAIEQRSIGDFAARWNAARAAIRADARYAGLDLAPQVGLVPLGPDPDSGLWEFVHLASGTGGAAAIPRRDARGRLVLDPQCGFVLVLLPGGDVVLGAHCNDPRVRSADTAGARTGHADRGTGVAHADPGAASPDELGLHVELPPHDPEAYPWEGPPYAVRLAPFLIGKHEATQAQWRRLRGRDPSYWAEGTPRYDGQHHSLLQPVEQVTWYEAHEMLRQLGLELPTAAQWEYAARGGTRGPRYTGGDAMTLHGFENVADRTWSGVPPEPWALPLHDGFAGPSPVGTFRANPFGLHDVYGNVAEWCRDPCASLPNGAYWYEGTVPRAGDGLRPAPRADPKRRVLRGGTFGSGARALRSTAWAAIAADTHGPNGVRPVRALQGWRDG